MKETIFETLKNLNFTEYEAKAYLTLLEESPLTGYAVAKNSGVPRSRIYEVLDSLAIRGDILVSPGNTPQYTPVPAKELIKNRRRKAEENLELAEKSLAEFERSANDRENIWNITGRNEILDKVKACISSATKRILLEVWKEEFEELDSELRQAAKRGVNVTIIAYGEIVSDFANVYLHYMGHEITEEYGGRWIVISGDDSEVVAGIVSLGEDSRAAWTMHVGLVMPITEVMIHDLYLMEIMEKHRELLEESFGKNLVNLRHKFSIYPDFKKHYVK
ncbi:TrmB family transcriptional regulator [Bacillus sp. ISL-40]|uniref:TrmB family transcriptional regulator n=1 Tax=unclassified Bacillus (in: firmicutes) TaxID=185979 RepID=UPI001BE8F9A7|nr:MULTISPECIES: TrmB family transcriptional regulator [unclassified Bacillus (in: firmicutes)]MBT2700964.1 TrmB family transcriptional regulator [Bacillus sp. ISL-40]MBT2722631.1 TrmB family transcriptional regulator [Bacillus sp. ISL-46]MBT2744273.1 TrmB family transcriptional regulator [Bacillus sp. ISL-77]